MSQQANENLTVSPFFLFFLIHGTQTGVGLLGFQSLIIKGAGQDAWISVALVGFSFHLVAFLMYSLLKNSKNGDIMSLHQQLFGRFFGSILNIFFYGYINFFVVIVLSSYLEVLKTWVFPNIPIWVLSLIILSVITNIVLGGFRVVTGICFWGVILPTLLLSTLFFPLKSAYWTNLLPVFNHTFHEFFISAKESLMIYLGPELLLIYFPFIKNNKRSQKWVHIGLGYSTILYLVITIITFVYYSKGQLEETVWPTLIMSKIIRFPFIERFEYIFIFTWFLVILPPCCVALWGGVRILKESLRIKPRISLWVSIIIIQISVFLIKNNLSIEKMEKYLFLLSSCFLYIYLPILFILTNIIRNRKNNNLKLN
ncbi:spore germination protein [Cytobacillus firmus]|uniref:spore germination protein n=1 Tax=Cytobacillus firmus TaxID=1399 RepID=UPI00222841F8|nr:spore germination protein [Cytobacillus firmus]